MSVMGNPARLRWFTRGRIRRALRVQTLICGCRVGVYELYSGKTVGIIDDRATACADHSHAYGVLVESVTQAHSSS